MRRANPRLSTNLILGAMCLTTLGCQNSGQHRMASAAPPEADLITSESPAPITAQAPPAQNVTFVDRHPLLSKPREYYETSGNNTIVKTAAATVIGVPVGLVGEMRQIVVGQAR